MDWTTNRRPVRGFTPKNVIGAPSVPKCAAGICSGAAPEMARKIVSTTVGTGVDQLAIGAG